MHSVGIIQLYYSSFHSLALLLTLFACFNGNKTFVPSPTREPMIDHGRGGLDKGLVSNVMAQNQKDLSLMSASRYRHTFRSPDNHYKLPSWFNYDQFKRLFGKRYSIPEENETHKRIYLRTALKVFEQRALYRTNRTDILPSINELSDMKTSELMALRRSPQWINQTKQRIADEPTCCSYNQVHKRIIELLDGTSGVEETDLALSRAYVDELQQKPIPGVESEQTINIARESPESKLRSPEFSPEMTFITGARERFVVQPGTERIIDSSLASTNLPNHTTIISRPSKLIQTGVSSGSDFDSTAATTEVKAGTTRSTSTMKQSSKDSSVGDEQNDFERAIEESVRQQIERQLSPNTSQGKLLTDRLSSYFGQPVKLTASIGRP